ncbi:MAG: HemK2/MTQ2 family protein methyltransferase [Candidatus Njordarchaeales archaeon]
MGIKIKLCRGVYPPSEDTFLLIDSLIENVKPGRSFLELGTGTGIIALIMAKLGLNVIATDINIKAIECARKNAQLNTIPIDLRRGDLFEPVRNLRFDYIAFNPPYLPSDSAFDSRLPLDEKLALIGGYIGNEIIMKFLKNVRSFLNPFGEAFLVFSSLSNFNDIQKVGNNLGLRISVIKEQSFMFEKIFVVKASIL